MSTTIKQKFGTANQEITIALGSLSDGDARQSTAVQNTEGFSDALVMLRVFPSSPVSDDGHVDVYAAATADDGTNYSGGASGADGSYTGELNNLVFLGRLTATVSNEVYRRMFSIAQAFGGVVPARWAIVVVNNTGASFNSSGNSAHYQGIKHEAESAA